MTVSDAHPKSATRSRCFFDVALGGLPVGRIVFELFNDVAPKTAENFRALCTGEKGVGLVTGKQLHYKNVIFHRVVKDFMIQAGDFSAGNGTGGESIYGGTFEDEVFEMKHDRPFLLSMANRGKNTNGSQFFITTQPAPHLDNVHVVFGHVISGQDLVRQLEDLPVDRNSRPLQDATILNCGELVRQVKAKKEKKKKKRVASSAEENSGSDAEPEKHSKRKEKKKKKDRKRSKSNDKPDISEDEKNGCEEGEVTEEGELHPLASVTKIDPDEIPEVSNKFLMRSERVNRSREKEQRRRSRSRDDRIHDNRNNFGWSKRHVPTSRSGRIIKGRGVFRFRTPSRSRSRSTTPPHWKRAQNRTIKLSDLERIEEEKSMRETEIKRREVERKKRHEEMSKDPKKSFYELPHASSYGGKGIERDSPSKNEKPRRNDSDRSEREYDREPRKDKERKEEVRERDRREEKREREVEKKESGTSDERKNIPKRKKSMDMNALDYEHQAESENEADNSGPQTSRAFNEPLEEKRNSKETKPRSSRREREQSIEAEKKKVKEVKKKDELEQKDKFKRSRSRSASYSRSRTRSRSPFRDRRGGGGRFQMRRQGFRSPPRRNWRGRRGNPFMDRRMRTGSEERTFRNRQPMSPIRRPRRSPLERRRSRDRNYSRSRSHSRSPRRDRRRARRDDSRDRSRDRHASRSRTSSRQGRNNRSGSRAAQRSPSNERDVERNERTERDRERNERDRKVNDRSSPKKDKKTDKSDVSSVKNTNEDDREKAAREKMQKRAEALQMFKDHMRKEIAKEEEKRAEKQRLEDLEKEKTARELEELERLKKETLQKLEEHEKLKKVAVIAAVAAAVNSSNNGKEEKSKEKKKKRKKSKKHVRSSGSESN